MNHSTPSVPSSDQTSTAGLNPPPKGRPHFARRRYLIDRRRQLRTAALTSGVAIFLLVVVNLAFGVMRSSQSMVLTAAAPQLRPVLEKQDATNGTMLVVFSAVFVVGVAMITIAETHRTAGAIYAVRQRIDRVRDGDLHSLLRLRKRDSLNDLVLPFNEMVGRLQKSAIAEADELDRLADEASSGPAENSGLAAKLREIADRKRKI
jgi:methyl-accepting chemotaxis protein